MRIWNDDELKNDTRGARICELLETLQLEKDFSLVDLACGRGDAVRDIGAHFPEANILGVDIQSFDEWAKGGRFKKEDMMDFIRQPGRWDVVMLLNSYRNWEGSDKVLFEKWLGEHSRYFIWDDMDRKLNLEVL